MKNFASRTGIGLAVSAATMSVVALLVPYGYPWPSLVWAIVACVAAFWVANSSTGPTPRMTDVISDIEAESVRAPVAPRTR